MHKLLHSCILLSVGCILIRFSSSTARNAAQSRSDQNRLLRATHGTTIKHHRQQQRKKRRRQRGLVVSRAKDIISFNEQSNQAIERSSSNTPQDDLPTRPSLPEFTYRYAKKACVKEQDIINISTFIKEMYTKHNIRVFPRNGFLLGIIRHGGFLPTEGVDADLGVVYEDLLHLYNTFKKTNTGKKQGYLDDDFLLQLEPTYLKYVNWHGLEPVTQTPYKYFGAMFRCTSKRCGGDKFRMHATSVYQYRGDTDTYFYPRCDLAKTNHDVHVVDSLRWNEEGGDYRLIDTDERINESNFNKDDDSQLASILKTSFDCFMDVQFYFTTIQVPCEYDEILTSMFGTNWRYIERRGPNGGNRHASKAVSEDENDKIMSLGPRPICEA